MGVGRMGRWPWRKRKLRRQWSNTAEQSRGVMESRGFGRPGGRIEEEGGFGWGVGGCWAVVGCVFFFGLCFVGPFFCVHVRDAKSWNITPV